VRYSLNKGHKMNMELLSGHSPELLFFAAGSEPAASDVSCRILYLNKIKSCCPASFTVVHPDFKVFFRGVL